jgi:serine protease AprX
VEETSYDPRASFTLGGGTVSKLTAASVLGLLLAFVLFASTAGGAGPVTPSQAGPAKQDADGDKLFDDLEQKLATLSDTDSLRVIVMLNRAITLSNLTTLQAAVGKFSVGHRYTIIPGFAATVTKAQAQALAQQPTVVQVEEDSIVSATNATAQASFGVTKARIDAGVTGDGDGNPNVYSKDDFVAAVIDTGIDASHQDLDGGKVIGWNDFVNGQPNPYDDNDHGTHVSATIAGSGDSCRTSPPPSTGP